MSPTASPERWVAGLRPVSLQQLEQRAALLDRSDHKYVLSHAELAELIDRMATEFDVLEIDGRRSFGYATRYFDDPTLGCFRAHRTGRRLRAKVRVRHYLDSGSHWLELKVRASRGRSVKVRKPTGSQSWESLDRQAADWLGRRSLSLGGPTLTEAWMPVLQMRYQRMTLVARHGQERMTIDMKLQLEGHGRRRDAHPDRVIIETKSPHGHSRADTLLRALGHRPVRHCSKYTLAVCAMGLHPSPGRFRPALRKLGLMSDEVGQRAAQPHPWRQALAAGMAAMAIIPPGWAQTAASGGTVEVLAPRNDDDAARRDRTAATLVVTREEIERMGDSQLTDLLKRLPGVVLTGKPGKDGTPKLRGLGNGYTQILIDGERAPRNFSLDSISPDQIERIEILRSATAETGTRAVAGSINIVLSDGVIRRAHTLRLSAGSTEGGGARAGANWRKADVDGSFSYDLAVSADHRRQRTWRLEDTVETMVATQRTTISLLEQRHETEERDRLNLSATLRWNLGEGRRFSLSPQLFVDDGRSSRSDSYLPRTGSTGADHDHAAATGTDRRWQARLQAGWRAPLGPSTRHEWSRQLGSSRGRESRDENQYNAFDSVVTHRDDDRQARENRWRLSGKLHHWLDDTQRLSTGLEVDAQSRNDTRTLTENGSTVATGLGDTLTARSRQAALFVQHEWVPQAPYSLQSGLRWEGIDSRGVATDGSTVSNRSSVLSPLVHLLWRPGGSTTDRVRLGLTGSYRPASLQELTAQPVISDDPTTGANSVTRPDLVGNPLLKPERATGIDLGWDRQLGAGSVFGIHGFARHIDSYIRRVLSRETVTWSSVQRWVQRPVNVGTAQTWGLDMDLRTRGTRLWPGAPALDLHATLGVYRSRVASVTGPHNTIDGQPPAVLNLGADYRLDSLPLRTGFSINLLPAYEVRQSSTESVSYGSRQSIDAYVLWTLGAGSKLRLSGTQLGARDTVRGSTVESDGTRQEVWRRTGNGAQWQLRWEQDL